MLARMTIGLCSFACHAVTSPAAQGLGIFTALQRSLEEEATARGMEGLIRDGVSGLIVCGTVGENCSLTKSEKIAVMEAAKAVVEATKGFAWAGGASSGEEALATAAQGEPDLVLVDVNMPRMDGFELTRRLRASHPRTLVALISLIDSERQCPRNMRIVVPQDVEDPQAVDRLPVVQHSVAISVCDVDSSLPRTSMR